ncbi:MAG: hypothetical protein AAGA86_01130 [Bacteroidota bacterium]
MARNRFEEHIREKLENREIKPSESAWQKVTHRLDGSPKKKSIGPFWYGIAASLSAILAITWFLYNQEKEAVFPDTEMANSPAETKGEVEKEVILPNTEIKKADPIVSTGQNLPENENVQGRKRIQKVKNTVFKDKHEDSLARFALGDERDRERPELQRTFGDSDAVINAKIAELVAQVQLLEQGSNDISDREIDSLLRIAQEELLEERLFGEVNAVDPMVLLAEVEDELDSSFRDQIFEKLKIGLSKMRTAVADRDH